MASDVADKFRHYDTNLPDGVHIEWQKIIRDDDHATPLDYLFQDPDYKAEDQARLDAFYAGEWQMLGIAARATIRIIQNGHAIEHVLTSGGLWGVESDSDPAYIEEVYQEEIAALKSDMRAMATGFAHLATAT